MQNKFGGIAMQKSLYLLLQEKLKECESPEQFAGEVINALKGTTIKTVDLIEWLKEDGYNSLEEYFEMNSLSGLPLEFHPARFNLAVPSPQRAGVTQK